MIISYRLIITVIHVAKYSLTKKSTGKNWNDRPLAFHLACIGQYTRKILLTLRNV